MSVTKELIKAKVSQALSSSVTIPDPNGTPTLNSETGEITIPNKSGTKESIYLTGDLKEVIDAVIEAVAVIVNTELEAMKSTYNSHMHPTAGQGPPSSPTSTMT